MLARSPLSKAALALLAFSALAHADGDVTWPIKGDRSTDTKHGLYEIQQTAAKFVQHHNKRHRTTLVVGEPDLRIMVPRCAVPLSTKWGPPATRERNSVAIVSCRKTVPGPGKQRWDVDVTVYEASEIGRPPSQPR
jgi:hypothetical protein